MIETSSMPTLSIVIPVYNVDKYVLEAVNSVMSQTVKPFEVIIVDDGSTDNSSQLVEDNYSVIPYVKIIHTENQGLGEARNVGTRAAVGDYIYYFDSDDILKDNLIEEFYKELLRNPDMDLYAFSAESFLDDPRNNTSNSKQWLPQYFRNIDSVFPNGEDAFNKMSDKGAFYPNAWLYVSRRGLHLEHNLFFKPIIHEDEEFTPRLFFVSNKTVVTKSVFFKRRVRNGSIMQTARSEKNVIGYIRSIETLGGLLSSCKYDASLKNIRKRISDNIIQIIFIKHNNSITFTKTTVDSFNAILEKYGTFSTRLASVNFFSYRVIRFVSNKIRGL